MTLAVVQDKTLDPVDILLLGANAVTLRPQPTADALEQWRSLFFQGICHLPNRRL